MPLVAWVTLIIAAVIIGLTAVALLRVILHLKYVRDTLGSVGLSAEAIAHQTRTVPEVLPSVNENLRPVREFTESV